MSKIRDALRKSEGEFQRTGAPRDPVRPPVRSRSDGRISLVPALSAEVLAHYESIGKQVDVALGETTTHALVFTASLRGEGCSTLISQYAETLARRGDRVLLVDGNPRHPSLHHFFNAPDAPGLCELVDGDAPAEAIIHPTGFTNLSVVPLGRCADRSQSERISDFLGEYVGRVGSEFDFVLVDVDYVGSPFFSSSAVSAGDGVVLIVRAGKTNREVATRACETVRRVGGNILGVILNRRQFPIPDFIYRRL